jgi:hypothetical protein
VSALQIVHIECFENLTVRLCFSDNTEKIIDIGNFIATHPHPQYNKYKEWKNFKKATIENGNVVWGKNWDLMFPIEQLYNGVIE